MFHYYCGNMSSNPSDVAENAKSKTVNQFKKGALRKCSDKSSFTSVTEHEPLPKLVIKNIRSSRPSVSFLPVTTKPVIDMMAKRAQTVSPSSANVENTVSHVLFSATTIADKVKLRARGKSNVSTKDIYQSVRVTKKTRKRRKISTAVSFFGDSNSSSSRINSPGTDVDLNVPDIDVLAGSSRESEVQSSQESAGLCGPSSLNPDIDVRCDPLSNCNEISLTDSSEPAVDSWEYFAHFLYGTETVVGAFEDAVEIPPAENLPISQDILEEIERKEEPVDFLDMNFTEQASLYPADDSD